MANNTSGTDKYNFEPSFEDGLLARLTRDKEFYKKHEPFIKVEYLESETRRDVLELVFAFHKEYPNEALTMDILRNEINSYLSKRRAFINLPPDLKKTQWKIYDDLLNDIYAYDFSGGDAYVSDRIIEFARRQRMKAITLGIYDKIENNLPLDPIADEVKECLAIGKDSNEIDPSKLRTWDDVNENVRDEDKWIVKGLIAKKAVNIWYGPPGSGKTHLGAHCGNRVHSDVEPFPGIFYQQAPFLYIDLENSESVRGHIKQVCGGGPMPLLSLEDDLRVPLINDEEKFIAFIEKFPPGVIIVDTLGMIVNTKSWADGKWDAIPVLKTLNRLKAKGYSFVLMLHSLKGDPKTVKAPQEIIGQSDHIVAIYPVSKVGEEKDEISEENPNKPKILFVGTRSDLKSRYDKSIYYIRFDPNPESSEKGFRLEGDPDFGTIVEIHQRFFDWVEAEKREKQRDLQISDYPNRVTFENMIVAWGQTSYKARKLIPKGIGLGYWGMDEQKVGRSSSHYYYPLIRREREV